MTGDASSVRPVDNVRGIIAMLAAVGLLSVLDLLIKLLSPHYPPFQVATLRATASLPFILLWIGTTVGFPSLLRVRWTLQLLRGVLAVGMMGAFVMALRELPLTTAYTLFFVAPLMITALSVPILGERVERGRWIAIVVGFAGTLVVLRPTGDGVFTLAGIAVLAAATGYAFTAITVRVLARTDSTQSIVFWLLAVMGAGSGALAAKGWVPIQPQHWVLIAGMGLAGALGQYAITEAFARAEASVIAPMEYSALAWGLSFDFVLWHVLPDRMTILGATIIVAAGLYLMRHEAVARECPALEPST